MELEFSDELLKFLMNKYFQLFSRCDVILLGIIFVLIYLKYDLCVLLITLYVLNLKTFLT